jgi:hypothetical protein
MAPSLIVISGEVNCLTAVVDVSRATRDAKFARDQNLPGHAVNQLIMNRRG